MVKKLVGSASDPEQLWKKRERKGKPRVVASAHNPRLGVSQVVPYTPLGGSTNDNTKSPHKAAEAFLCPVAQHVGSCFSNKGVDGESLIDVQGFVVWWDCSMA